MSVPYAIAAGLRPLVRGVQGYFLTAFLVDKVTKEPPVHIQAMVEAVRIPRGSKTVSGAH